MEFVSGLATQGRRRKEEGDAGAWAWSVSERGEEGKGCAAAAGHWAGEEGGPCALVWAGKQKEGRCTGGPRVGRGDLGHQARNRERRGFVLFCFIFYFHFFYSKAIFKTVLKITLN